MGVRALLSQRLGREGATYDRSGAFALVEKVLWIKIDIKGLELHDVIRLEGDEELSTPFLFTLLVRQEADKKIPKDILGTPASLAFLGAKGNPPKPDKPRRFFHGLVSDMRELTQPASDKDNGKRYKILQIELRPHFWFLKNTRDSLIFQNETAFDIAKKLLKEYDVKIKDATKSAYTTKRLFCVQYKESYFDFISRLLEEEGIGYYFAHAEKEHTMVLFDKNDQGESAKTPFVYKEASARFEKTDPDVLWSFEKRTQPVATEVALNDYAADKPTQKLMTPRPGKKSKLLAFKHALKHYIHTAFFCEEKQGKTLAENRIQSLEWPAVLMYGHSTCLESSPGTIIETQKCPDKALNTKYLVVRARHSYGVVGEDVLQGNMFTALPMDVPYRAPLQRERPKAEGPLTATVTGPEKEEIWCDEFGRIKIKFHWDKNEKNDDTTSCWVRVLTSVAGNGWGSFVLPRVGQEVLVHFEEGDIERPIVIGCLYNGDNKPPYDKKTKTMSSFKTRSTKKGEKSTKDNFNELRFNDAKGEEEIFLQAEKDTVTLIKNKKTVTIEDSNFETTLVSGDRKTILKADKTKDKKEGTGHDSLTLEKGNRTIEIKKGHLSTTLGEGNETFKITKGDQTFTIDAGSQTITIGKDRTTEVKKDDKLTIKGGWTIKVDGELKCTATKGISFKTDKEFKVDCKDFTVKASKSATIKASASLDLSSSGATLKGSKATVKGSGPVTIKGATVNLN